MNCPKCDCQKIGRAGDIFICAACNHYFKVAGIVSAKSPAVGLRDAAGTLTALGVVLCIMAVVFLCIYATTSVFVFAFFGIVQLLVAFGFFVLGQLLRIRANTER